MTLNLCKRSLPHLGVVCAGARVLEHRFPIFRGERGVRSRSGAAGLRAASAANFSICLGFGMRQLAGRSDILDLEHSKNKKVESAQVRMRKNDSYWEGDTVGTKAGGSS